MKTQLLKVTALSVGILILHLSGFAQQLVPTPGEVQDDTTGHSHAYQEVIIRQKTGKDAKVTVEIKNGELFINGKPASEYEDDNLAITKRKVKKDNMLYLDGGDIDQSPFRQQYFFKGDRTRNKALLGVTTTRKDNNGPAGATITDVAAGSAADKAGLKIGDIITKVDEIDIASPSDLVNTIGKYDPREKATITYLRDGKEQKVTLTLGENKDAEVFQFNGPDGSDDLGLDENFFKQMLPPGYNYNFDNKSSPKLGIRAQDIEGGKGARVLYVDGQSAAARAGMKEQDIITAFDGHPVSDATTLAALARESHLKPSVKVNVIRDGKPLELEIKNPVKLKSVDL